MVLQHTEENVLIGHHFDTTSVFLTRGQNTFSVFKTHISCAIRAQFWDITGMFQLIGYTKPVYFTAIVAAIFDSNGQFDIS
jgi:hypothetical protein